MPGNPLRLVRVVAGDAVGDAGVRVICTVVARPDVV